VTRERGGSGAALLVVKIGGSLLREPRLGPVVGLVAGAMRPIVVVPGGGVFADTVRECQAAQGFDDATAHRMALLAMHQTGLVLAGLAPRLTPAGTLPAVARALASGKVPVWLPLRLSERDRRIPADWSITSDGLAARLAERLGAPAVLLLKSCAVPQGASLAELTRNGIVDARFAEIVDRAALSWRILGAGEDDALAAALGVAPTTGPVLARDPARSGSTPASRRARGVAHGGA
jgi:hypothetical protein